MKERLRRLARRLRKAAIQCHCRGMVPAGEWLEDFAADVDRMLVEVRLRELIGDNPTALFTAADLQSADYVLHLNGRCVPQKCLFHLADAHTSGSCTAGCRWCTAKGVSMRITGRDYTDDDLIAPWDPARRQRRPNRIRDDPDRDRDDLDDDEEPAREDKP